MSGCVEEYLVNKVFCSAEQRVGDVLSKDSLSIKVYKCYASQGRAEKAKKVHEKHKDKLAELLSS